MRKRFVIDPDCPILNNTQWTSERKNNINKMFEAVQGRYKAVNGEVGVVFSSVKSDNNPYALMYNIDGAREIPSVYRDGEWYPDAEDTISYLLSMAGISASTDEMKQELRLCPWHNHYHGTEFSTPDMILLVDFFPYIHESYLDVECVQRLALSDDMKDNLKNEQNKSEFLCSLHNMRIVSCKMFESALDNLDREYMDNLNAYAKAKEAALAKGDNLDCVEFESTRKAYVDEFEKIEKKFKEYTEATAKFIIYHFSKKEIED